MTLFVAGLSHKNAPVELREQLAVEEDKLRELLSDVSATGAVRETLILSTCNRVEVYGVAEAPGEARAVVFRHLCRYRGVPYGSVEPLLYTHLDGDAVHHAFRVAASLDSMMIGEPQILGQVKDAFGLAQACATVGPALHTLFTAAFAVAKKVRTETEIARHAVSVSFAAVELARKIFAGLGGKAVLLVGAGKMGELAARHLVEHGASPVYVANRTWPRAQEMARALSGAAVPFAELETALAGRAARGDPGGRGAEGAGAAAGRNGRDARGDRGALGGHREQDLARADHEAARIVARGLEPLVAPAHSRALRPGTKMTAPTSVQ